MDRPRPPQNLSEESLLEWHRICDELSDSGRLEKADRAILILYAETWGIYRQMMIHVAEFGPVVKFNNGVAGNSPQFKTSRECANLMRVLLSDLGLTPLTRSKVKPPETEQTDLTF